ncbi:hypothetical protein [Bacillus sp. Marseille-P3800]|uniref:hypothetical protein n=1 Tax=Bacillus sp. Marseille-P3800 TaxID=2014782 RepID=UPI001C3F3FBA
MKSNSDIHNLEWVTAQENAQHASITGLLRVGERHPLSKITEEQARNILNDYYECKNLTVIFNKHSYASKSIIRKICKGSRWKHLDKSFERPTTIPLGGEIPQQEYGASYWRG